MAACTPWDSRVPTLVIVRHAKAEAPASGLSDHDRPLALKGRSEAGRLAERLVKAGIMPSLALVSSAARAQQTAKLMTASLPDMDLRTVPEIYETGLGAYLEALGALDDVEVVATVGHEPTSSALAAWLSGPDSDRAALQRIALGLQTSGAAVIEVPSWAELDRGVGRLIAVYSGKA